MAIFLKLFLIIAFVTNLNVVFVLMDMKLNIGFGDKMSIFNSPKKKREKEKKEKQA